MHRLIHGQIVKNSKFVYKGIFDAFRKTVKEEGLSSLWNGLAVSNAKLVLLILLNLYIFPKLKNFFEKKLGPCNPDSFFHRNYSLCSLGLAASAAIFVTPLDNVQIRMQCFRSLEKRDNGIFENFADLALEGDRGIPALWAGIVPYVVRLGLHTVLSASFHRFLRKRLVLKD
jgi:hypothetical protein